MSDRLLELLSQNAGMGDEVAALQAQLLRAKGLRTQAQTDPRRTTAKGGMFSALARGVNAYRAGTMEADTETAQAGIDARSAQMRQAAQEAVGGLPSITPEIDPRTGGYAAIDPAALAQHRALGRALGSGPLPDLAKQGASISGEAEKAGGEAAKLANLRTMGLVETKDGRLVPVNSVRSNYNAKTGGYEQVGADFTRYGISPEVLEAEIRKAQAGGGSWKLSTATGADGLPIITGVQMIDGALFAKPVINAPAPGGTAPPAAPAPPGAPAPPQGNKVSLPGALGPPAPPPPAKPKVGTPGAISQPPYKPQSTAETEALSGLQTELNGYKVTAGKFKDDFAGMSGAESGVRDIWGGIVGAKGSTETKEYREFWGTFKRMVQLKERHDLFGSALSANEQRIWNEAQSISASSPPDLVRRVFGEMITAVQKRLDARAAVGVANYRNPAAVQGAAPSAVLPGEQPKKRYNPATGKVE